MRIVNATGRRLGVYALVIMLAGGIAFSASPRPPLDARHPLELSVDESTGPIVFWLSALADALHIETTARSVAAVATLAISCVVTGWLVRKPWSGAIAAVVAIGAVFGLSVLSRDLQAAVAATAFHLLAVAFVARSFDSMRSPRTAAIEIAVAGLWSGFALLCRGSTWFVSLPLFAWLLLYRLSLRDDARRTSSSPLALFTYGYLAPLATAGVIYAAAHRTDSYLQWLLRLRWEQAPTVLLGYQGWMLSYPALWLLAYAVVIPSAVGWLRHVRRPTLDDLSRAWGANGVEVTFGLGALSWLAVSPFPAEDFGVLAALGGASVGFCVGLQIDAFTAALSTRRATSDNATMELDREPGILTS